MPSTHNALTRASLAAWGASGVAVADLESLETKVAQGVNGDLGGTYAPTYYAIEIYGSVSSGLVVTGPTVVWGKLGALTLVSNAAYSLLLFPALGGNHPASTHVYQQDCLTGMTSPVNAAVVAQFGVQAIFPSLLSPVGAVIPVYHVVPLFAHDGATLSSMSLQLMVPTPHTSLPPTMPTVQIVVSDQWGNLTTLANYTLPAPSTPAAWYANGAAQTFTIPVAPYTVNNATGLLYAIVTDEQGLTGFPFQVTSTSVDFATTGVVALNGAQTIDGHAIQLTTSTTPGNRVLVKDQVDQTQNGIYLANAGQWARSADARTAGPLGQGQLVTCNGGNANAGTLWQQQNPVTAVTGYPSWLASPATHTVGDIVCPTATSVTIYGVASIPITGAGGSYTGPAQVTITGPCTVQARAHVNMAYSVTGTTNLVGGDGYTSAPTITPVGGGPGQVTITPTMSASSYGISNNLTLTDQGSGYGWTSVSPTEEVYDIPNVTVSGGGGSGAVVVAQVGAFVDGGGNSQVGVLSLVVQSVGYGYTSTPTIVIDAPLGAGTQATCTATLGSAATYTVASLAVSLATAGYTDPPSLVFSGGGGSGASAQAVLTGVVSGSTCIIDDPGAGYTSAPSATISGTATLGTVALTSPGVTVTSAKATPGIAFQCSTAGTAGTVQPNWPTVAGQVVTDGSIVWTAVTDPGALLNYGTTQAMPYNATVPMLVAYGTIFLGFTLTYTGIADTRWE